MNSRSDFTSEKYQYLTNLCEMFENYNKIDWKLIVKEFNERFNVSKKKQELQEQYDYVEGRISMKQLSEEEKELVINLKKEEKTFHFIARQLKRRENLVKNYYYREYLESHKSEKKEKFQENENGSNENIQSENLKEIKIDQSPLCDEELIHFLEGEDKNPDFLI
jgi:hypothetical protein